MVTVKRCEKDSGCLHCPNMEHAHVRTSLHPGEFLIMLEGKFSRSDK